MAQDVDSVSENAESEAAAKDEKEKDNGRGRFLFLPFIITELAIGEGLGGALLYFHGKKKIDQPPITSAA